MRNGWTVSGTTRSHDAADTFRADGIRAYAFGPDISDRLPAEAFSGVTHLIASIPPGQSGDPALVRKSEWLPHARSLRWVAYLSTPAVYGDRQGGLVSEEDTPAPGSARGQRRLDAENSWLSAFPGSDVSVQVFRLSGIYGPGRNAIDQLRAGTARIIEKPGQVFNRIHVDDIGSILVASMERPRDGAIYNVADDEACPSGDVIRHAAELLGMEAPRPIPFDSAELSPMARSFYSECKRLDTSRLKSELGVDLRYPTYREGLRSILDETGAPA